MRHNVVSELAVHLPLEEIGALGVSCACADCESRYVATHQSGTESLRITASVRSTSARLTREGDADRAREHWWFD
jgi:hypothetical protein